ncbi:hypothetical protein [Azospira sp. I09]|jgi:hypothetical protein|uniref:hypothetical protein n=1 Tax=Azospira sp. I09 TaxID=1765049 RepID=UPI0012605D81|nr:hypothetical protein [Azospira sp. I09]BBN88868.1 hypothetical protein AZSP09_18910 [Azospira sp. I09]
MSDTRPVPTNLDGWVGVTDLVVSYKHILHVLWSAPSSLVSVIGVGRPGIIEHLTGAARQDEPVIVEALRELHRRGLVVLDEQTREVAIRRWCRFHKFNGRWAQAARIAFDKIESPVIKGVLVRHEGVNTVFPEKSKAPTPNSNSNFNNNAEAAPGAEAPGSPGRAAATALDKQVRPRRGDETVQHGVEIWTPADAEGLQDLAERYGAVRVEEVANALAPAAGHRAPYLSTVVTAFQKLEKAEAEAAAAETRQKQLDIDAAREAERAEQAASALDHFHSLDRTAQSEVLEAFSVHLAGANSCVFQMFRRNGLKSKPVEAEFVKFLLSKLQGAAA